MTWSARDSMVKASRGERGAFGKKVGADGEKPAVAAVPDKVPRYAENAEYRQRTDDETPFVFTRSQEVALMEDGIWPDRQWSIWRHAMTRGIQEQ